MATVSHDSQTFLIDARRIWLVSGAIHYPRVPRALWRSRIRAAKQAGLNCIETYVFWNAHEPAPGRFDFSDNLDLRAFVRTVGEEGLFCIVRPGPFICAEWDNGGLPPWLSNIEGIKLREGHPAFLEACARYMQAVMDQVKDLQITEAIKPDSVRPVKAVTEAASGAGGGGTGCGWFTGQGGGPVIMMQVENEWFCHNPAVSTAYNDELLRYLREGGCSVPLNNCNNLWQRVDRTIDTWNGSRHLAADLRQLRIVQPNAPRFITEYWPGWFDQWAGPHSNGLDADTHLYRLAGIAAVGGQANMYMFHGGTNFAFWGGRTVANPYCFMTTSYDYDAPLLEAGGRGPKYLATKRLCVFQNQFGHVFAQAAPDEHHSVVALTEDDHPPAVMQLTGSAGQIVFVFRAKNDKTQNLPIMLPNGLSLTIPLGEDRVAWFMLHTPLGPKSELTYTNLRPWALVGKKMLVLYGPAEAAGVVCINDAAYKLTVPATGQPPLVERHEDVQIVVLNREQVDSAYLLPNGVVIGAEGLDDHDQPIDGPHRSCTTVDLHGKVAARTVSSPRKPAAPKLSPTGWTRAGVESFIDGTNNAYKEIDGPASLEKLGQPYGYGWYKIELKKAPSTSGKLLAPLMGDRLHVYTDGQPAALLGLGPAATWDPIALKLGKVTVGLCDNLGRMNYSLRVGERKGLFSHIYAVKPVALGKPKVIAGKSADPFVLRGYVPQHRVGETRAADALVWKIATSGRKPLVLDFDGLPLAGVLHINGVPLDIYDAGQCAHFGRWLLPTGAKEIKLALYRPLDKKLNVNKHVKLYACTTNLTEAATWSFARWTVPTSEAFSPATNGSGPCWWRTTFTTKHATCPLWLEPTGLTKGQIYLNGHNAGRYFVATPAGDAVTPQERYYLPEPWLHTDADNELLIFDEHGAKPTKAKLVYDPMGPYGK